MCSVCGCGHGKTRIEEEQKDAQPDQMRSDPTEGEHASSRLIAVEQTSNRGGGANA